MKNYNYQWSDEFSDWPEDDLIIRANELPVGIYKAKVFSNDLKVFQYRNNKWVYINNPDEISPKSKEVLIVGIFELLKPYKQCQFVTLGVDEDTLNLPKGQLIEFEVIKGKKYAMIRHWC